MSDMLQEALIKLLLSKTREAGESIKPGVERSGTPGPTVVESRAREACGSAKKGDLLKDEWLSPTSWALLLCATDPGVPLRSTPGFMLTPRFAGSKQTLRRLDQSFLQFVDASIESGTVGNDKLKFIGHKSAVDAAAMQQCNC